MSDQFVGEIKLFAGDFAPNGFAFCNGQLMSISQNTALFSLLGTFYGGDGRTTFGLPNLQGRAAMHQGQGPGLSFHNIGDTGGEANVKLNMSQMPAHRHALNGVSATATSTTPAGALPAEPKANVRFTGLYSNGAASATANPAAVQATGGSQPHNNLQPYLALSFIIALVGIYPARN